MRKLNYSVIVEMKKSNKGTVCLAKADGYDFPVVVKELKQGNSAVYQALQQEKSEFLPEIYHVEEVEEGILVVEEYVEGELLSDYIVVQKLTEEGCIDIAGQICKALEGLHSHQPPIIHRDIKPSNIIISSKGTLKLIDFDSSRVYKAEMESDTRYLGTEKYAPPEQYGFSQTDCRSDIYSLGVVLEKFTGFISKNKQKKWKRIVEKCTLFAPDSRYQSVAEVEKELKKINKKGVFCLGQFAVAAAVLLVCLIVGCIFGREKQNLQSDELPAHQAEENESEHTEENAPNLTGEIEMADQVLEDLPLTEVVEEAEILDEKYRTIPPEFRDLESDSPEVVSLKQHIRENSLMIEYCFKDRMENRDFYLQVKELDYETTEFHGMKLYENMNPIGDFIDEKYVEMKNGIVAISEEYMKSLNKGYYTLATVMSYGSNEPMERGIILYVADSDILEEPECPLQNTTYDYIVGGSDKIHIALKNDSLRKIIALGDEKGNKIDSALYEVSENGMIMQVSEKVFSGIREGEMQNYKVICEDGSLISISITGILEYK